MAWLICISFLVTCSVVLGSAYETDSSLESGGPSTQALPASTKPVLNTTMASVSGKPRTVDKVYKECGSLCEPTCTNPRPEVCPAVCKSGLFCPTGYVLNSAQECVLLEDCGQGSASPPPTTQPSKPLNAHKVYNNCGTACPATCANPNPRPCVRICNPDFFCPSGYLENSSGKCVLPENCDQGPSSPTPPALPSPPVQGSSFVPKQWKQCGTACPLTCADPDPRPCILVCKSGWFCPSGYYLNSADQCVTLADCKRRSSHPLIPVPPPAIQAFPQPNFGSNSLQTSDFPKFDLPMYGTRARPEFQIDPVVYNADDVANGGSIPPAAVVRTRGSSAPFVGFPSMVPKTKPMIDLDPTVPRPVSRVKNEQSTDDDQRSY